MCWSDVPTKKCAIGRGMGRVRYAGQCTVVHLCDQDMRQLPMGHFANASETRFIWRFCPTTISKLCRPEDLWVPHNMTQLTEYSSFRGNYWNSCHEATIFAPLRKMSDCQNHLVSLPSSWIGRFVYISSKNFIDIRTKEVFLSSCAQFWHLPWNSSQTMIESYSNRLSNIYISLGRLSTWN